MSELNYLWPLTGGLLIGLSAGLYLLLNGRIAGVSGLTAAAAGLTSGGINKLGLGFLAGIIAGAWFTSFLVREPHVAITSSPALLIAAGLIVGYGTRLGSGCTSGHGVCGIARLSRRSLAATAIFMAAAGITVFVTRHLLGGQL
ncbi:YeeE/YedE family protein (plasmid) [Ensifer sp. PDNC004]|uniref:YeeE/YedE family protein n=1 Tax=unclassified Ensifer TaxID=2633371 RepID=UPI00177BEA88|nr:MULTISPECIES: YeeE/YedE thiosulfate transporter family protein [unclassified Ensifer]MBD9649867.1 YeeE/YedE family protein [Ensifer sp. ENS09]QRY70480.1 YeeE/YedE family protein [Ensifer sp. PDNC004]